MHKHINCGSLFRWTFSKLLRNLSKLAKLSFSIRLQNLKGFELQGGFDPGSRWGLRSQKLYMLGICPPCCIPGSTPHLTGTFISLLVIVICYVLFDIGSVQWTQLGPSWRNSERYYHGTSAQFLGRCCHRRHDTGGWRSHLLEYEWAALGASPLSTRRTKWCSR